MQTSPEPKKIKYLLKALNQYYPHPEPPLDHASGFQLLVAVALSAQTTDARVNLVTPELFAKGGTPAKMASLQTSEILRIIRTCGLAPTKAKNLSQMAKLLVEKHAGQIPRTLLELEALPGVGHKTASVILSQVFQIPAFPVDTHIHRLAKRWKLSSGKNVKQTEIDLKHAFPEATWNKLHLQIIFYGREHCTARGCDGTLCPICEHLNAHFN